MTRLIGTQSSSETTRRIAHLSALLERQRWICRAIQNHSATQSAMITNRQTDDLLRVLSQRQELINELMQLGEQLEPYRATWEELLASLDASEKSRIESLTVDVDSLIQTIMKQDMENQEQMITAKDTIKGKITSLNRGKQSNRAYRETVKSPNVLPSNRYMDQHG